MSVVQRHSLAAAGLVCLAAVCPGHVSAQVRGRPNPDTPRLLVATFRTASADSRIGVEGAAAVRARVQREARPQDLWVIPKADMDNVLRQSDVPVDSVLSLTDLKVLAQSLRADAIVDGVVAKTQTGVELRARYVLPSNLALIQPLPTIEAPSLDEAAKELERRLAEVQRSLLDFRRCSNALVARNYDAARLAAQEGIARYPSSTLSRLCLMDALSRAQQPTDSIIIAAQAVLRIDSTSTLALMNLVDAYKEKHDTANAVAAMQQLVVYRPDLRRDLTAMLGQMNRPKLALLVVAELLRDSPGDPEILKQRWLLLLADHRWKEALAAGTELVGADTTAASADYFTRSIAAALSDSQPALAADIAVQAVSKFPRDASLWALSAQAQRKAGRSARAVEAARRALALDSHTENGWPLLILAQLDAAQTDSAIASARLALTSGVDSATIGRILQLPLTMAARRANDEKTRAAWLEVVRLSSIVDSIVPSVEAKYFLTVGAFSVGLDALQTTDGSRCDNAKLADEMWTLAMIDAPQGARAGPEQRDVVTRIMKAISDYSGAIAQAQKVSCKRRR
jgi:tetratricopeptide (TPR) repeat protein